jgi:hypothetical protein
MRPGRLLLRTAVASLTVLLTTTTAFADATVVLVNINAPGVGLNDPTPVAPVGGNGGTTIGQQRLNALQHAANLWGATLDSPVPIRMQVAFTTRTCNATSAVLASAGALIVVADFETVGAFPGPVAPNTWHHSALANKRAGVDLAPGDFNDDLRALFNINLGQPTCLVGSPFYLGLDGNGPAGSIDLVTVALHEFAHGLGFSSFADLTTGANFLGLTDVYARNVLDTSTFKTWDQMTDAERLASSTNSRRVVWDGPEVTARASDVLVAGVPLLRVVSPVNIAGTYDVGTAEFGAPLTGAGIAGSIVQALDAANAAGPTTFDACTPITNGAAVAGRIALVDRGTCGFVVKAANVQAAGAIAMIVADNVAGGPPAGLGGTDPSIVIPAVRITLANGNTIKAQLGQGATVNAQLGLDLSRLAGTDPAGRVLINAPNPVVPGSSISHWDPIASRNLLMEPNINADLTHELTPPHDLTLPQMRDVGWFSDADNDGFADDADECDASDLRATLFVADTNTGVANEMFSNGCTMSDYVIAAAAGARNHGAFVSAVAHLGNAWRSAGLITDAGRATIQTAAAQSNVGKKK